jgi:transcriptional regulator with GAF, ATPase, and Fis domain
MPIPLRGRPRTGSRTVGISASDHPAAGARRYRRPTDTPTLRGMSVTREAQLIEAFVKTADTLIDDFDVIEFLHTLAGHCVQLLDVDAAGLLLADTQGTLHATAASHENAHLLALFELQADAGPCMDCFRTGAPVVNSDLQANRDRWPSFAEAAQATGFFSAHALPLRVRETVIGALNLLCARPGPLGDPDVRTGQALADVAAIGILAQRSLQQAELLTGQLQNALTSRVTIEQAKGVLAERRRISVDAAFDLLRSYARSRNLPVSDLARDVVDNSGDVGELLRGPGPGQSEQPETV